MRGRRPSGDGGRVAFRASVIRTGILVAVLLVAALAFTPWLGPFRLLFRLLLVVGVLALVASYLWPRWQRIRRRFGSRDRA